MNFSWGKRIVGSNPVSPHFPQFILVIFFYFYSLLNMGSIVAYGYAKGKSGWFLGPIRDYLFISAYRLVSFGRRIIASDVIPFGATLLR